MNMPAQMGVSEDWMRHVAAECRYLIVQKGDEFGLSSREMSVRYEDYRSLGKPEQWRVQIMLCQDPALASTISINGAGFRFYARGRAPSGAFNILDWRRAA